MAACVSLCLCLSPHLAAIAARLSAAAAAAVAVLSSGKTTQLPRMLLEAAAEAALQQQQQQDSSSSSSSSNSSSSSSSSMPFPAYIVCTQPRRLAAVSVASRVATEMGAPLGGLVGYHVRLQAKMSENTRLLFCTHGILLRQVFSDE